MNNMDHNQNTITNILRIDNNTNFRNIGKQKNTKICDLPNDFLTFIYSDVKVVSTSGRIFVAKLMQYPIVLFVL